MAAIYKPFPSLTVGQLKKAIESLPDDAEVAYEGDVDSYYGKYVVSSVRVEDGEVVIS